MRVSVRAEELGGHTHVGIWVNGGKEGTLIFRNEEWPEFERALDNGLAADGHPHRFQTVEQATKYLQRGDN